MTATQAKPRALRKDAARNLRRILDAADALFAEEGVGVSVEQIAARAGVGVGTVYRRFPSKEALVERLVSDFWDDHRTVIREALDQPPGRGIEFLVRGIGELFMRHQGCLSRQILLMSRTDDTRRALRREFADAVAQILERDQAAGSIRPEIASTDFYLLLTSLQRTVFLTACDAPDAWRRHADILLAGISATGRAIVQPPISDADLDRIVERRSSGGRRAQD